MGLTLLRFGILGCGTIAHWHARAIAQLEGTVLAGVSDRDPRVCREFARKYGAEPFENEEALLKSGDIDVVCICTASGLHASQAVRTARAGKHVVVEKPMGITLQELEDIENACKEYGVKLCVISQLRFSEELRAVKQALDGGKLGRLLTGDVTMKFFRSQEYYKAGGWRGTWNMDGGGALMNQGIHGVDLLQYLMGPVKTVFGFARTLAHDIETEDTAVAAVEFKNGALGHITGTTAVYPGSPRVLELNGTKGSITLTENRITRWEVDGEPIPAFSRVETPDSSSDSTRLSVEGHLLQLRDMAVAIRENRAPLVDQHEGQKSVKIILAIYQSSKSGLPVRL